MRPLSRYLTISSQAGNKPLTAVKKYSKLLLSLFKKEREREEESKNKKNIQLYFINLFHKMNSYISIFIMNRHAVAELLPNQIQKIANLTN